MNRRLARAREIGERLVDLPGTAAAAGRMAWRSGLVWTLGRRALPELARILASGSQNPAQLYRFHGCSTPDKAALIWRGVATSWAELNARVDRIACGLLRRGIGRGRRILVFLRNRPECVEVGAGAARAGAAAVSVSWRSTPRELAFLGRHSGAEGIVLESALLPVLRDAQADLPPRLLANVFVVDDVGAAPGTAPAYAPYDVLLERAPTAAVDGGDEAAVVIYTSGTTGTPKGAVRKFPRATVPAAMRFVSATPMRATDVHLVACPLYHSTAFGFLSLSHMLGSTAVIMEEFRPELFLELVARHRVTTTALVPTMIHRILALPDEVRRRYRTDSLRLVFSGGAQLPGPLAERFLATFGDVLYVFYGATETGLVTLATPTDLRLSSTTIGRPLPDNELRLLDDRRVDVAPGEVGELFVKNKLLVAGYHEDDRATRESMVDGYFSVGDLARRDARGLYYIEGRKRDMIISGGTNVYPAELEQVLAEHPAVDEVAVVGVPDEEWGERPRAYVVVRAGAEADEAEIVRFARERLSGPKVPREVRFLDALPKNPTGKVLKRELRELS